MLLVEMSHTRPRGCASHLWRDLYELTNNILTKITYPSTNGRMRSSERASQGTK